MNPLFALTTLHYPVLTAVALLTVSNLFMTFAWCGHLQPVKLDFLWAGLCLMGAVYFILRS